LLQLVVHLEFIHYQLHLFVSAHRHFSTMLNQVFVILLKTDALSLIMHLVFQLIWVFQSLFLIILLKQTSIYQGILFSM
jgi:hypothetical protein